MIFTKNVKKVLIGYKIYRFIEDSGSCAAGASSQREGGGQWQFPEEW